ncbi:MAG: flagellar hook-basal body complex protein FliE [Acetobacteraceae bacterium]|nr:flagellar hook-basal body complex protein FliE [Acetobacteraceae bacterium]
MTSPVSGIPTIRITPPTGASPTTPGQNADFGAVLRSAVETAVDTGREAETQSMRAITQGGNVTEVATALSRAELTLQTATAVRDRMLQAYQDIMKIQI